MALTSKDYQRAAVPNRQHLEGGTMVFGEPWKWDIASLPFLECTNHQKDIKP